MSATKSVRPSESTAETQPQLQPGFAEIVSDYFPIPVPSQMTKNEYDNLPSGEKSIS